MIAYTNLNFFVSLFFNFFAIGMPEIDLADLGLNENDGNALTRILSKMRNFFARKKNQRTE